MSPVRRGLVAATAAAALLSLANTAETTPAPEVMPGVEVYDPNDDTKSRNTIDIENLPLGEHTLLQIHPVTINAEGFAPAAYGPEMEEIYDHGWSLLELVRDRQPNIDIEIKPVEEVTLPGIAAIPDLCHGPTRDEFRQKLIKEVLSSKSFDTPVSRGSDGSPKGGPGHTGETVVYEKTVPIIVFEQAGDVRCVLGDANENGVIVIYDGNSATPGLIAHEGGHFEGAGHDSALQYCNANIGQNNVHVLVGKACRVNEYGSGFTRMGHGPVERSVDADIFSAYGELQIGGLTWSEVHQVDPTHTQEQIFDLSSLENADGGMKAIRIPIAPDANGQKPVIGMALVDDKEKPVHATAAFIELSGAEAPYGLDAYFAEKPVSIKIYLVDEEQGLANTYLLPVYAGNGYDVTEKFVGRSFTFSIGTTHFTVRPYEIESMGNQVGNARVGVAMTPSKGGIPEEFLLAENDHDLVGVKG